MRISDWSSDVCSSYLFGARLAGFGDEHAAAVFEQLGNRLADIEALCWPTRSRSHRRDSGAGQAAQALQHYIHRLQALLRVVGIDPGKGGGDPDPAKVSLVSCQGCRNIRFQIDRASVRDRVSQSMWISGVAV